MAQNINIDAHVKRYENTELSDIVKLIAGLTNLIEGRKNSEIDKLKQQLAMLEQGQIPEEPAKVTPKRTRGGKKIQTEPDSVEL